MTTENESALIEIGVEIDPIPHLGPGWRIIDGTACFLWNSLQEARLRLTLPPVDDLHVLARVSALSDDQKEPAPHCRIKINGVYVEEWRVDSTATRNKLLMIPPGLIPGGACVLSFTPPPGLPGGRESGERPRGSGMRLHSFSVGADLDAALNQLQTGYDWFAGCRDKLVDSARRVLFQFENVDRKQERITGKLQSILQDPYVRSRSRAKPVFDRTYFKDNYQNLKEGVILHELRAWDAGLKKLDQAIIDAGNWASNRPCARYHDPANLESLVRRRRIPWDEKVRLLRERNETLNDLEILLQKDEISSVPSTIYLDITNVCNFRCKMCYQSQMDFKKTKLMNEHVAMVIRMLPYIRYITVAGLGEPLLSDSLKIFSDSARSLRCHTSLVTNGSLIRKRLASLEAFSLVNISFDGAVAETFETLRNGANFKKIIENIRLLRETVPDLALGFSVVVSRANLDELAGIVVLAGELGINEISMNPVENMPILELKASDRTLFEEGITRAKEIAVRREIALSVNVGPGNFSSKDDRPRDKKSILANIRALKIKKERHYDIRKITRNIEALDFSYYPAPAVFAPGDPSGSPAPPETTGDPAPDDCRDLKMDLDAELSALQGRIDQLTAEIKAAPRKAFPLPYCLDPWKLNYIKSNGKNRLCCHADVIVGDMGKEGFRGAINGEKIKQIRRSMFHPRALPPPCRGCRAADRFIRLESLRKTGELLQIEIEDGALK